HIHTDPKMMFKRFIFTGFALFLLMLAMYYFVYRQNILLLWPQAFPPAFLPSKVPPMEQPGSQAYGAGGAAFYVNEWWLSPEEAKEYRLGWEGIQYNQFASDRISVRRYLPDNRELGCKQINYNLEELEKTSVIIPFHNEPYTIILRL
ncbi:UDP-N-acetyl-alpha-D-galactosamine polypeptide N-acetylgalactosaminyltransferase, partial [Cichlidogyrus casuarinus]